MNYYYASKKKDVKPTVFTKDKIIDDLDIQLD